MIFFMAGGPTGDLAKQRGIDRPTRLLTIYRPLTKSFDGSNSSRSGKRSLSAVLARGILKPSRHLPFLLSGRFWNGTLSRSSVRNRLNSATIDAGVNPFRYKRWTHQASSWPLAQW